VVRATVVALGLLLVAVVAGLLVGTERVDVAVALADPESMQAKIIFGTRAPRVVLAALVGAALAPAGLSFQALLRNPLAEPYVLGVAGGAAVAGTIAIVLGVASSALGQWSLPVWAFVGALGSIAIVWRQGRVRGRLVPNVALLAGVVINSLAAALVVLIRLAASPNAAHQALVWLAGSLRIVEAPHLGALGAYVVVGVGMLMALAVPMNALALGEEQAHIVGVDVERARRALFAASSLLTGAAVAFAGPVGFVGILVPHAARALIGPDHRVLVPVCALVGAAFLVVADTAARLSLVVVGQELPVGVLTAVAGAPFFLVVLRRRGAERGW
jgi:iron complex transport system permease protein